MINIYKFIGTKARLSKKFSTSNDYLDFEALFSFHKRLELLTSSNNFQRIASENENVITIYRSNDLYERFEKHSSRSILTANSLLFSTVISSLFIDSNLLFVPLLTSPYFYFKGFISSRLKNFTVFRIDFDRKNLKYIIYTNPKNHPPEFTELYFKEIELRDIECKIGSIFDCPDRIYFHSTFLFHIDQENIVSNDDSKSLKSFSFELNKDSTIPEYIPQLFSMITKGSYSQSLEILSSKGDLDMEE